MESPWPPGKEKIVGVRRPSGGGLREADRLLAAVVALRKNRKFIPRGVYRFHSFEEATEWSIKMMARR